MVMCSRCTKDAVMFCAECGKPICEVHAVHGRYCSGECHSIHSKDKKKEDSVSHHEEITQRRNIILAGSVATFFVLFAVIYFFLVLMGV